MSKAACVVFHIFRIETDNLTGLVEFPMHYEQINDFQLFLPIIIIIIILITEVWTSTWE